jgi:hypothetical protein
MQERFEMKKLLLLLCVAGTLLSYGCKSDNEYYSYDYLKNDYDQVAVVASVNVQDVKAVDSIGDKDTGYVRYLIRCQVIEPFKGDIKSNQELAYYSVAERGYDPANFRGKRIVFLGSLFDKQKKDWILSELENSSRPALKAIIKKMRQIKRQAAEK